MPSKKEKNKKQKNLSPRSLREVRHLFQKSLEYKFVKIVSLNRVLRSELSPVAGGMECADQGQLIGAQGYGFGVESPILEHMAGGRGTMPAPFDSRRPPLLHSLLCSLPSG